MHRYHIDRPSPSSTPIRLACLDRALPTARADAPVAILCHGFTDHMCTPPLENLATALLARGWRVIQFDFNGHGESGGDFSSMTVENEVLDLQAVLSRHSARPVALAGHSQGAVVAALAASRAAPGTVSALALLAPAPIIRDHALRGRIFDAVFDPENPPPTVPVMGGRFSLGRDYILSARNLRMEDKLSSFPGPVCVVHGALDAVVPWPSAKSLLEARSRTGHGTHDRWNLLPGTDHNFTGRETEASEIAAAFLSSL